MITHIDFTPDHPTPEPPAFAAFRLQRERELTAAIAHKAITDSYGTAGLPSVIPFHWSAEKVKHFANGGAHRQPVFVGKVGTRVSAMRRRVGQLELRAA